MRMGTKGRFAVNAMIDLALRDAAGPVALAAIASRQQISLSYLEQLFARLRGQGLVRSARGPGGGYTLARGAEDISVADIVCSVEDELAAAAESGEQNAAGASRELWSQLGAVMRAHMATISLKSLIDDQVARGVSVETRAPRRAIAPLPRAKPLATRVPNSVFAFGQSFVRS